MRTGKGWRRVRPAAGVSGREALQVHAAEIVAKAARSMVKLCRTFCIPYDAVAPLVHSAEAPGAETCVVVTYLEEAKSKGEKKGIASESTLMGLQ
jgi:hypothetical protein